MSSEQDPYIKELQQSSSKNRWSILAIGLYAAFVCAAFLLMVSTDDTFGFFEFIGVSVGGVFIAYQFRLHYRRGSGTATPEELKELAEIEENARRQREWERKRRW